MPDFVRLVNEDYKTFDFHQNNVKRIIRPGEDAIVPWNIAVTLFGHPNIPDIPPANERTKMYEKIRARHNFSAGLQTEEEWEQFKPHIRVIDVENDREVVMLIDDPAGEHAAEAPTNKKLGTETDIAVLQRQIEMLTNQVSRLVSSAQSAPSEAATGSTSSPTAVADSPGQTGPDIDSVFNLPTSDKTATQDTPQAVTSGEIPTADADTPPASQSQPVPKKVAAKKVAAKAD